MNIQKLIQYIYDTTDFIEVMSSFAGPSGAGGQLEALLKLRSRFRGGRRRGTERFCLLHRLPDGKRQGF